MKKITCLLLILLLMLSAFAEDGSHIDACPDLAVTGALVWQILDDEIRVQAPDADAPAAVLTLSGLAKGGVMRFQSIADRGGDGVLLVLALDDGGARRVQLVELSLMGDAIAVGEARDATQALGFLFDDGAWIETDMSACDGGLFIAALDPGYTFHLFRYDPEENHLLSLGERPLERTVAAVPYGADMLLVGADPQDETTMELTRLSLADGSAEALRSATVDSALRAFNFAYSAAEDRLYFTQNSTVYALTPGSGDAPAPVGALEGVPAMLRLGAVAGNRFVTHAETPGRLLSCDLSAGMEAVTLRVENLTGEAVVYDAARDFSLAHPSYTVSVAGAPQSPGIAPDPDCDAWVLPLNSSAYRALRDSGALADLSGSAALAEAAADMTGPMQSALRSGDALMAFPVSVSNPCQLLNVPALQALTGLDRASLPTDWAGFLRLLGRLAEAGSLIDSGEYCLSDPSLSADTHREMLISWLIQDCATRLSGDGTDAGAVEAALREAAAAFTAVDWSRLGLPEEDSEGPVAPGAPQPLLMDGELEIAVMATPEGYEFWPLSLGAGAPRQISQTVAAVCVNAASPRATGGMAFAEYLWQKADAVTKAALCQSLNEPVVNDRYEADLADLRRTAEEIEQALARAATPSERAMIASELDELKAYIEDYQGHATWLISAQSAALYRSLSSLLTPGAEDIWEQSAAMDALFDFLDGLLTPEAFASAFVSAALQAP